MLPIVKHTLKNVLNSIQREFEDFCYIPKREGSKAINVYCQKNKDVK